jgi:S-adenosylmethionine hydrolase
VVYVDRFANLITNIPSKMIEEREVAVRVGSIEIRGASRAYGDVPPGTYLATLGSWGALEISKREGRAAESLRVAVGDKVEVEIVR